MQLMFQTAFSVIKIISLGLLPEILFFRLVFCLSCLKYLFCIISFAARIIKESKSQFSLFPFTGKRRSELFFNSKYCSYRSSRRPIFAEFRGLYQSAKIKIHEIFSYFLRNYWRIRLQFAVVTYSPAVIPVIFNYLKTICHYKPFD